MTHFVCPGNQKQNNNKPAKAKAKEKAKVIEKMQDKNKTIKTNNEKRKSETKQ